jgi:hypothetical protein
MKKNLGAWPELKAISSTQYQIGTSTTGIDPVPIKQIVNNKA